LKKELLIVILNIILIACKMAVKFLSKQSSETKPPKFYKVSLLVTIVIVINAVIGGFSGEDLK